VKRCLLLFILTVAGLLCARAPLRAQIVENLWQPIGDFPGGIKTVYFLDLPGPPRIGFVGSNGGVYRTSDGGATWAQSVTDVPSPTPTDFTFKDSLTGWFANYELNARAVFKTTDGGITWTSFSAPIYRATSIYYNPSNRLLLLASWKNGSNAKGGIWRSTDEGANWNLVSPDEGSDVNGFAFLNGDSGTVGTKQSYTFYTRDGGFTWQYAFTDNRESWQPLADTLRRIIWYPSENEGIDRTPGTSLILQSADAAKSIALVGSTNRISGTMRVGSCATLYMQNFVSYQNTGGILRSTDGQNWSVLLDKIRYGGPVDSEDTRFYVKGTYIFAGGKMRDDDQWRLWRYVEDSTKYASQAFVEPKVSAKQFHIATRSCNELDSSLYALYLNDCIPGILVSAELAPTERFVLHLSDSLPHEIKSQLPIQIGHRPQNRNPDTTELYLHYFANGADYYDTVLVTGAIDGANVISPFEFVANDRKDIIVHGGDTVFVGIRVQDPIPASAAPDSVEFGANYDDDVLSFLAVDVPPPFSLLHSSHSAGNSSIAIRIPANTDLPTGNIVGRLIYRANVSTTETARYLLTNMLLNGSPFDGCGGPASLPEPPRITVSGCADTLYQQLMLGQSIVQFLGIERQGDDYVVRLKSLASEPIEIDVYDLLGQLVSSKSVAVTGEVRVPLDVPKAGVYFVRVGSMSRMFVVPE